MSKIHYILYVTYYYEIRAWNWEMSSEGNNRLKATGCGSRRGTAGARSPDDSSEQASSGGGHQSTSLQTQMLAVRG